MDWIYLSVPQVREIHEAVLAAHGGATGLRDQALLESAVAAPQASRGGEPMFTDPRDIAAAYLFYLCRNQAFIDGNKRAALAAAIVFLRLNGLGAAPDDDAWEALVLDVAASRIDRGGDGGAVAAVGQGSVLKLCMEPLPPLPEGYERRMPRHREESALVEVGTDRAGNSALLSIETAEAWQAMRQTASAEGVTLLLISAFRSCSYQEGILRRKLARGIPWEEILKVSAFPGFSEHHTGKAIDMGSPDAPDLEEDFERTGEFRWLTQHAAAFGFTMSYPRNNPFGILCEPWHWALVNP